MRRPYVAIWIEDANHFPVRTLGLWYQKPRWLPNLNAWHHADQMRNQVEHRDITASVTSATRHPGKYTVKWDGKDDTGSPVPGGVYFWRATSGSATGRLVFMR